MMATNPILTLISFARPAGTLSMVMSYPVFRMQAKKFWVTMDLKWRNLKSFSMANAGIAVNLTTYRFIVIFSEKGEK